MDVWTDGQTDGRTIEGDSIIHHHYVAEYNKQKSCYLKYKNLIEKKLCTVYNIFITTV